MALSSMFVRAAVVPLAMACFVTTAAASGQAAVALAYDVVSIKLDRTGPGSTRVSIDNDVFMATNVSVKTLLIFAYKLKTDDQISGLPGWANSTAFDIEAKVDAETLAAMKKASNEVQGEQRLAMMQALLADRFQLKVHRETKVMPTYTLVVAKGGAKIKAANPDDTYPNGIKGPNGTARGGGMMMMGRGTMTGQGVPIDSLVRQLASTLHRQVEDKTGLAGKFDFSLRWTPEDASPDSKESSGVDTAPSIYTALQEQLGLRLDSTKGPVDVIVVDHVEMPSAN